MNIFTWSLHTVHESINTCCDDQGFDEQFLTFLITVSVDTDDSKSWEKECWREEVEEAGERLIAGSEGEELCPHSCISPVSDLHRSFESLLSVEWLRLRLRFTCFLGEELSLDWKEKRWDFFFKYLENRNSKNSSTH